MSVIKSDSIRQSTLSESLLYIVAALLQIGLTLPTATPAHTPGGRSIHTVNSARSSTINIPAAGAKTSRNGDESTSSSNTSSSVSVLFLLADDLGYANVGWHEDFVLTPHLDRLAKQGITLESYYVQPICSPTRSALMTYAEQHSALSNIALSNLKSVRMTCV
jgi:hypothetical protein